jgi:hypothetical protein
LEISFGRWAKSGTSASSRKAEQTHQAPIYRYPEANEEELEILGILDKVIEDALES